MIVNINNIILLIFRFVLNIFNKLHVIFINASFIQRDVAHLTTCDEGCFELAELLGWKVTYLDRSLH